MSRTLGGTRLKDDAENKGESKCVTQAKNRGPLTFFPESNTLSQVSHAHLANEECTDRQRLEQLAGSNSECRSVEKQYGCSEF